MAQETTPAPARSNDPRTAPPDRCPHCLERVGGVSALWIHLGFRCPVLTALRDRGAA